MEILKSGALRLGLNLTPRQLEQFETYYRELVAWNTRMNLTRITGYEEVQTGHFLDALTVTLALRTTEVRGLRVIDIGSGGGLPGIPLHILWPGIRLVLLEATAKKARFLSHIITRLGWGDVEVVVGRAEEVAHEARYRERFDLVVSRAVAPLPTLVELTLPFCAVGGQFIAQKKAGVDLELSQASPAIELLGGNLRKVKALDLPEFRDKRCLVVIDKVRPTPDKYPRRPGVPARRPIG